MEVIGVPIGEALGSFITWLSPSSIFDVVEDHCPLPCFTSQVGPSHFFFRMVFPCVYFSTTVCKWIPKSTGCGGLICDLLLFYSIFPVQSRFNEDLFKKNTPTSPTNEAVHEYINEIVSTLGALQQNRTLRELTFSGDVDDMTVLASTLKVNTTLQRIESQGDIFTGHLELLFQELLFFWPGEGRVRIFPTQNNRGQLRCRWVPEFSDFCSLDLVLEFDDFLLVGLYRGGPTH